MIRVAVVGAVGRMGRMLVEALASDAHAQLSAAIVSKSSKFLGMDAGEVVGVGRLGVNLSDSLENSMSNVDSVIDFTSPAFTLENVALCALNKKSIVIGTTGFDDLQKRQLQKFSEKTPIVFAPNMSVGINLVFTLLETAAKVLKREADVEIIEAHHRNKVDAPSGTSLQMGEIVANATGRNIEQCAVYGRDGDTGVRDRDSIGFSVVRAGDIIGDHTVLFGCEGERVEITHKASSRIVYVNGALKAVSFLNDKISGLYDMQDVLGLR